ncbi:LBL_2463 family protein [Leptospira mayottensis]|uniref:Uncharacterized protein n=2 Tax=Leptospira mayottensis TaxID=1137606 RepID=A0AA87MTM3_9LEPT|nr:hypothetical protein [Leptospira mayottensis]AXR66142.1 hypothetical protein DQM28_11100 [Leptospira mayottensis]EKS01681.1 hypothetical protein LEP1GSC125_1599 [Leptospira mayottensis 200901122]
MSHIITKPSVKIITANDSLSELTRVKEYVTEKFKEAGYSDSPWRRFNYDEWSTWFYYENNGEILAVMRLVEKKPWNIVPLEFAVIYDEKEVVPQRRYAVIEDNVADWNAVAFETTLEGWVAAKRTFRTVARYCVEKGYNIVYGMYPVSLKSIRMFYKKSGAVDSLRFFDRVYFPGFYLKGELCYLNVIELEKETLQEIASKSS